MTFTDQHNVKFPA